MSTSSGISRRGLLAGLGAVGGAAALGTASPAAASPDPHTRSGARPHPDAETTGFPPPIASAPVAGVSYRFRMFEEVFPEGSVDRGYGGAGITGASGTFATAFDLPLGAVLYDVEWYYRNEGENPVAAELRVWGAGQGHWQFGGVDVALPTSTGIVATRARVPSASNGPFPFGTRVVAAINQMNFNFNLDGVRVGFKNAPLSPVLLTPAVQVYDSRDHTPLAAGKTRTISLASLLPVGANGALFTLTALGTHGAGSLSVGAAGSSLAATGVVWGRTGDRAANSVSCAVDTHRAIGIHAHVNKTDFIVDLTGYLI